MIYINFGYFVSKDELLDGFTPLRYTMSRGIHGKICLCRLTADL